MNSSDDESDEEDVLSDMKQAKEWLAEEEDSIPKGPPRTKNELPFDNSCIYDPDSLENQNIDGLIDRNNCNPDDGSALDTSQGSVVINVAAEELTEIGTIMCRMDEENTLVVQASFTQNPLNEGSLLCFKEGTIMGKICEIFGPITTPFYVVKWAALPDASKQISATRSTGGKNNKKKKNKRGSGSSKVEKEVVDDAEDEEVEATEEEQSAEMTKESTHVEVADKAAEAGTEALEMVIVGEEVELAGAVVGDSEGVTESSSPPPAEAVTAPVCAVSAAQAEHFALLMSRALTGTAVFSAAKHTVVITASSLNAIRKQSKGTDASNLYDEEIDDDEQEYSDDEEELLAKQERNRAKRTADPSGATKSVHPTPSRGQSDGMGAIPPGPRGKSVRGNEGSFQKHPPHSVPFTPSPHYQQQAHAAPQHGGTPHAFNQFQQPTQQHIGQPFSYHHQQQQFQMPFPHPLAHQMQYGNQEIHAINNSIGYGGSQSSQPPQYPPTGPPSSSFHSGQGQGAYYPTQVPTSGQQWGNEQQYYQQQQQQHQQQQQQQQQPMFSFPTHIQQSHPAGQIGGGGSLPWAGFGGQPSSGGRAPGPPGQGPGPGPGPGGVASLPAYVYQPIQYNQP